MIEAALLASALALATGLVPGPFTTLVITTALDRGAAAAARVALVPLATEVPVMLITAFILTRLPETALRWVGVVGGVLVFYMAWRVFRTAREQKGRRKPDADEERGHMLRVALVGLFSPAPWVFWLLLASPLLLRSWHQGWGEAAVFVGAFFGVFIGTQLAIAWMAARSGRGLGRVWRQRLLHVASAGLVVGGAVLIWQSWEGNFQRMIQTQESITRAVRS